MKKSSQHILLFWSVILFFLFTVKFLLFSYDPLHIYSRGSQWQSNEQAKECENLCKESEKRNICLLQCNNRIYVPVQNRYTARSLTKHLEFDWVIIGSSVSQSMMTDAANDKIWWKFINLAIQWSNHRVRKNILQRILKNKEIKNVILTFDFTTISKIKKDQILNYNSYKMLYDQNPLNDRLVYLNKKFLVCTLKFSKDKSCIGKLTPPPTQTYGYSKKSLGYWISRRPVSWLEKIVKQIDLQKIRKEPNQALTSSVEFAKILAGQNRYINETFIQIIDENPETNFYVIIPALARMRSAQIAQNNYSNFARYQGAIEYVVRQSDKYPNMKVYWFANEEYVERLGFYRDRTHYSAEINDRILDSISKDENILTSENIDTYLLTSEKKALQYSLKNIVESLKGTIARKKARWEW